MEAPVIEPAPVMAAPPPVVEKVTPEPQTEPEPVKNGRLVVSMKQSGDDEDDLALLRKFNRIIKDYSGPGEIILKLVNGKEVNTVRFDNIGNCEGLRQQLGELVGDEAVTVENN